MGRSLRMDVIIVGGGIAGLTLAGFLAKDGIMPQVYDAAPRLGALGLGVNLLPHAPSPMAEPGLLAESGSRFVQTRASAFFHAAGLRLVYPAPASPPRYHPDPYPITHSYSPTHTTATN